MNTRPRGRPKLQETAGIDRAIHDAAIAALLEHGDGATLNMVAELAGLSRKSVYARYSTKAELFVEAIRTLLGRVQQLKFDATGSAEQCLHNYLHAALELMATSQAKAIQGIIFADPAYLAVLREDMISAMQTQFYAPLRDLLQRLREKGAIVPIDEVTTARAINALVFAYGTHLHDNTDKAFESRSLDEIADALTHLIARGMLPR